MRALKRVVRKTSAVLAMSTLLTLGMAGAASAATGTYYKWTGASSATAGLAGCASNCWSVPGNWDVSTDGGVTYATATSAPVSTDNSGAGDNLVFDNSALSASVSMTNDISNLTVDNLATSGSNTGGYTYTLSGSALTVTGGVGAQVGAQLGVNNDLTFTGNQTFGVTGTAAVRIGGAMTIASGTLTADANISPTALTIASGAALTLGYGGSAGSLSGSGSVTLLTPTGTSSIYPNSLYLYDSGTANTYSGTIDLQSGAQLDASGNNPANSLGAAVLTVENGAQLYLYVSPTSPTTTSTLNITNAITIGGNGAGVDQMSQGAIMAGLYDSSKNETAGTLTVNLTGAVSLTSDTTLSSVYATDGTYNFTNLTQNGHALTVVAKSQPSYGTTTAQINGKTIAGGTVAAAPVAAPKTPNTGFALVSAKPATTLLGTMLVAGGIFAIALKSRKVASRR